MVRVSSDEPPSAGPRDARGRAHRTRRHAEGYDPETLLPAISCPVLILQADPAAGGALSDEEVEKGLRLLPRATHVRLEGIGHELHGLHAQRVLDAIGPFLESV